MFDSVRAELKRRGVESIVLILRDPTEKYFEELNRVRHSDDEVYGFERHGRYTSALRIWGGLPLVGPLIAAHVAYRFARSLMQREGIDVLATTDDRALIFPLSVLHAARSLSIKSVLLPIETIMFVRALEDDKAAIPEHSSIVKRLMRSVVEHIFPANARERSGHSVHFYQLRTLFPFLLWRSILPKNPWVRGSHAALESVAVNSRMQLEENVRHGVSRDRMYVTGFPPHDRFTSVDRALVRKELNADLHIRSDSKIFLIVGTHLTGEYTPEQLPAIHRELRDMYATIVRSTPKNYTIVMKMHPQAKRDEDMRFFGSSESRSVVFLQNEWDVYRLTLVADAVCMFTSSASIAALATDVPVLAYELKFPSYDAFYRPFTSIEKVRTIADLEKALTKVGSTPTNDMLDRRVRDRTELGMFDGKNTERVADLVESLIKKD